MTLGCAIPAEATTGIVRNADSGVTGVNSSAATPTGTAATSSNNRQSDHHFVFSVDPRQILLAFCKYGFEASLRSGLLTDRHALTFAGRSS